MHLVHEQSSRVAIFAIKSRVTHSGGSITPSLPRLSRLALPRIYLFVRVYARDAARTLRRGEVYLREAISPGRIRDAAGSARLRTLSALLLAVSTSPSPSPSPSSPSPSPRPCVCCLRQLCARRDAPARGRDTGRFGFRSNAPGETDRSRSRRSRAVRFRENDERTNGKSVANYRRVFSSSRSRTTNPRSRQDRILTNFLSLIVRLIRYFLVLYYSRVQEAGSVVQGTRGFTVSRIIVRNSNSDIPVSSMRRGEGKRERETLLNSNIRSFHTCRIPRRDRKR